MKISFVYIIDHWLTLHHMATLNLYLGEAKVTFYTKIQNIIMIKESKETKWIKQLEQKQKQ